MLARSNHLYDQRMVDLQALIETYQLQAHPEGGWFAEVYRSKQSVEFGDEQRNASTGIFYVLEKGQFSAFHRIDADEGWHHYAGAPIQITMLDPSGCRTAIVGSVEEGYSPQFWVPAGVWFAATPVGDAPFSLVGCTVAPGFEFRHFKLAERSALLTAYPEHEGVIRQFTRDSA